MATPKFVPKTYVRHHPERGDQERVATTAADAVRLEFDGWQEKPTAARKATAAADAKKQQ